MPIFQTAMFEFKDGEDELRYVRYGNNPNQLALQRKLAALEQAEDALVTASGMAAISSALLSVLRPGDHFLAQDRLYGGTHTYVTSFLAEYNIAFDFIDANRPDTWPEKLRASTRAMYVETITNPLIDVGNLEAVAQFARNHGLVSMIDNTFASPVNFRPAEWGYDLSLHSATKYLNGHSDLVAGAAVGRADLIQGIRDRVKQLGGSLDPHACFLLHRGVKTLAVRVGRQNETALSIARLLDTHPAVARVYYAGLPASPSFENAQKHLDGFGGMLSFELHGGVEAARTFMRDLTIPILAPSLGGVETLVVMPALSSHRGLSADERRRAGISDGLIRMSVGIESADDLIRDIRHALSKVTEGAFTM